MLVAPNIRLRIRLRVGRDRRLSVTRRHILDEVGDQATGDGRAITRRRVPADAGIESDNSYGVAGRVELERRVGAAGHIVERSRMRRVRVTNVFANLVRELCVRRLSSTN